MEKLKTLIKKICNKEVISYLIFGVLTTIRKSWLNGNSWSKISVECQ